MDELKAGGFRISQGALEALGAGFASGRAGETETSAMIARAREEMGELLCPHSAVGVHVAQGFTGATPLVTLATAHPAKFPDAVEAATGIRPALPSRMADLFERPERVTRVANDLAGIERLIEDRIGEGAFA
jgi:threonine synthase